MIEARERESSSNETGATVHHHRPPVAIKLLLEVTPANSKGLLAQPIAVAISSFA